MTDKEKILQEIERLQKPTMDANHNFTSDYNQGFYDGLSQLELFIDSLPEKKALIRQTNVGEAMEELEEKIALYKKNHKEPVSEDLEDAAMSYGKSIVQHACDELRKEYGGEYTPGEDNVLLVAKYFKAGAEWQKEQMMKDAVETTVVSMVHQLIVTDYIIINAEQFGLKKGDKVKVLIIKDGIL